MQAYMRDGYDLTRGGTRWLHGVALVLASCACIACGEKDCSGIGVNPVGGEVRAASGEQICDAQVHVTAPGVDVNFECGSDAGSAGATGPACCTFRVNGGPGDATYTIETIAAGYAPKTTTIFVHETNAANPCLDT